MGILSYIRAEKENFKQRKSENMKIKKARYEAETKALKEKEDYYKAIRNKQKTEDNIRTLKRESFNNSFVGRVLAKSKSSKVKARPRMNNINYSYKSAGIGNGFGSSINPAFSLGKEKPKEEKKRAITIKINQ